MTSSAFISRSNAPCVQMHSRFFAAGHFPGQQYALDDLLLPHKPPCNSFSQKSVKIGRGNSILFVYGYLKGDSIKALLLSKQTISSTLPLSAESSHFTVKGYQSGQRRSHLCKSLLPTPSSHSVLRTFGNSFQVWLHHLSRDRGEADEFPRSSLLTFLKRGVTSAIFQTSANSPNHHDVSKMT